MMLFRYCAGRTPAANLRPAHRRASSTLSSPVSILATDSGRLVTRLFSNSARAYNEQHYD
jgi:hypothetical protein